MRASPARTRQFIGVVLLTSFSLLSSADGSAALTPAAYSLVSDTIQVSFAPLQADQSETAPPAPEPLTRERLIDLVAAAWPEDPDTAVRILICESQAGEHPDTFNVEAGNGGPMQLNRYTWEPHFGALNGWTWEQIVQDIDIHLQAARIVYDRGGGWEPWRCR